MLREWLFSTLSASTPLTDVIEDRIYQGASLQDIPDVKPYLLYRFGTRSRGLSGADGISAWVQPLQIFVHDNPGDYVLIDGLLDQLTTLLQGAHEAPIVRCEWLEDSEDLRDDEMFTIMRFSRYQLIHT